ncbi:MAG: glutathione peroxidase [Rubritepida sp.]|nr:glutathione peroxidase [Rubritepida sp.]
MTTAYDFSARGITGAEVPLGRFRGQVLLIVNTASKCGFTPQYEGLEKLHAELSGRGLAVLGFPSNQFGAQEPGSEAEIGEFCKLIYDVGFPMFAKVDVNGPGAHPLYQWLKSQAKGFFGTSSIKWNFTKFLVDREGKVVRRYGSTTKPEAMKGAIERLLDSKG